MGPQNYMYLYPPLSNCSEPSWIAKFMLCKINGTSARSKFWGVSGSEDRGGGDNSIQFINFRRVGDKSFKEWRQKIGGGGVEG